MPISTNSKLTTVIPFDLIVDTDYGLIQLIKEKYYDRSVFNGLITARPMQLIYILYSRKNQNPLYPFMDNQEDFESMNNLYAEFLEKEYVNILKNSITTELFNVVKLFNSSDGVITPIILCRNELEETFMSKLSKVNKIIPPIPTIRGNYDNIDISAFDPIYFKFYSDTLPILDKLNGKNLYIANYGFNFNETEDGNRILLPDISVLLLDHNIAKITDIYNINEEDIPVG